MTTNLVVTPGGMYGSEVIVTFQTGALAGYDFAIVDKSWDNSVKQLKLKQNENEDALTVPGDINFEAGDTFMLAGLKMPQSYIDRASEELLEEAQKWLDEKCENRVQLRGDCDNIWFAEHDIAVSCGQLVGVYNEKLDIDREIRVTACKRYIENKGETPYRYELTISDFLQTNGFGKIVDEIKDVPNKIEKETKPVYEYSRRRWRDTVELSNALRDAFKNFSDGIDPVFVRTMQLVAGDERLQFRFVDRKTNPTEIDQEFRYNEATKVFSTDATILQHMTLGIDTLSPGHNTREYRFWDIREYSYELPDTEARWLYVAAIKDASVGTGGVFIYKCIAQNNTTPLNTSYWKLLVTKGEDGADGADGTSGTDGKDGKDGVEGQGYLYAYYPSDSLTPPSRPPAPGAISSGWITSPDFSGKRYLYVSQCIRTAGAWGAWSSPKIYSVMPEPGDPGPAIVFRGDFLQIETPKVFYNNAARRDVVRYSDRLYYIFKGTDGSTQNTWIAGNWESFGAQFSSVATNLLLAENANVGGWIFKNERLESQSGGAYMDGRTGVLTTNGGIFRGSIATPFVNTVFSDQQVVTLTDNFNIATGAPWEGLTIKLPTDIEKNGIRCLILNVGISKMSGSIRVVTQNGYGFLGVGIGDPVYHINILPGGYIGEFNCVVIGDYVYWVCMSYKSLTTN